MALDKEKQKVVVVGALGAVLLAVGAFQFIGKSSPPPAPAAVAKPAAAKDEPSDDEAAKKDEPAIEETIPAPGSKRDPFEPVALGGAPATPPSPEQPQPTPPDQRPTTNTAMQNRARWARPTNQDRVPPMNPMAGRLPMVGADGRPLPGSPQIDVQPTGAPARQPGEFAYSVVGVIDGERPLAVLRSDEGNQRLVPLGGQVDGGSRVVGIRDGVVTIEHRGKRLSMTVGGTSK